MRTLQDQPHRKQQRGIKPGYYWIKWVIGFLAMNACVDRISFNIPLTQNLMVVEGMITSDPGPYTVRVSHSLSLAADSSFRDPVQHVQIDLHDDEGHAERLQEVSPGVYQTNGAIQGQVGHAYFITMQTADGKSFVSAPDTIHPVGTLEQIKFSYEARTVQENFGPVTADIFNIYVDASAGIGARNYVRWRFTGTYKAVTNPELRAILSDGYVLASPPGCSGYVIEPGLGGGILTKVGPCTCCTCWITQNETIPTVSDGQLVANKTFRDVKVAEVPINSNTFADKFLLVVEQMSLTQNAYHFFDLIHAQKAGASSLFQPPYGEIKGNITALNSNDAVVGLFWGTAINKKYTFIQRSDVPYLLPPPDFVADACTVLPNSSTNPPEFWQ